MALHNYQLKLLTTLSFLLISSSFAQPTNGIEDGEQFWKDNPVIADEHLITSYGTPDLEVIDNDQPDTSGDGEDASTIAPWTDEGSGDDSENAETTTAASAITEAPTTIAQPQFECTTAGVFTNTYNCNEYVQCTEQPDGTFEAATFACPPRLAYNNKYQRCTRDLSDCQDNEISCLFPAKFPVANDNTTYWWCTPAITGGHHIFLVQCPPNQYFFADFGQCFYDWNNLPTLGFGFGQPKDEDAVKMELKMFKQEEKLRLKQQKMEEKAAKKLQKQLEKQAKKEAKEKAKLIGSSEDLSANASTE